MWPKILMGIVALPVAFCVAYAGVIIPPLGFALAAAAGFAFLAFTRPQAALLATFFLIPFEYLTVLVPADAYGSGGPLNYLTLIKLMFGAMIVAGLLRMLVEKDERFFRNFWITPLPALIFLFYFMCWMSLVNVQRMASFAVNMISIGSGVIAFLILINLVNTRQRFYTLLKVVFASYIIVALMGLFEAVTKQHVLKLLGRPMIERPWTQNKDAFRICGPSGDPDYYAISIIFGLMITFAIWPLVKGRLARMGLLAVAFLHFLAIVATASRGAAVSLAMALGLFYLFVRMRHKILIGMAALVILLGGFAAFSLTVSSRAAQRYAGGDVSSWVERWGWISMCYDMMLDAPIRGQGSGQFAPRYRHYMQTYRVPREPESAQNTYAQLAAQDGIPTTLVYFAINAVLWIILYRVMRDVRDPSVQHMAVSFLALALSFFIFSLTLDLVETEISWLLYASGVILWRFRQEELDQGGEGPAPAFAATRAQVLPALSPAGGALS
jgi:hypothetical protein